MEADVFKAMVLNILRLMLATVMLIAAGIFQIAEMAEMSVAFYFFGAVNALIAVIKTVRIKH